jgi:hypothetical protein
VERSSSVFESLLHTSIMSQGVIIKMSLKCKPSTEGKILDPYLVDEDGALSLGVREHSSCCWTLSYWSGEPCVLFSNPIGIGFGQSFNLIIGFNCQ